MNTYAGVQALNARWKACNLSKEPLREPIVACELGNLYNKDEMIRFLIDRSTFGNPPQLSHIRRSKVALASWRTRVPLARPPQPAA